MLRLIITDQNGKVQGIREIIPGSPILTVMDNVGKEMYDHVRITLWCDENGNMGEREYNSPTGGYDMERVTMWARDNVWEDINAGRKIHAIKKMRVAWPLLRLKSAKDIVDSIIPISALY